MHAPRGEPPRAPACPARRARRRMAHWHGDQRMAEDPRNTGGGGNSHNMLYFIVGGLVVIAAVFFFMFRDENASDGDVDVNVEAPAAEAPAPEAPAAPA